MKQVSGEIKKSSSCHDHCEDSGQDPGVRQQGAWHWVVENVFSGEEGKRAPDRESEDRGRSPWLLSRDGGITILYSVPWFLQRIFIVPQGQGQNQDSLSQHVLHLPQCSGVTEQTLEQA